MKILNAEQMRELDRKTIEEIGIPGIVLMENAGQGAARLIVAHYSHLKGGSVLILAGKGNNGGDGYVIARCLMQRGWRVRTIVLASRDSIAGDARANLDILLNMKGEVVFAPDQEHLAEALEQEPSYSLYIDALFGTGLSSEVRGHYAYAIDWLNDRGSAVVSVDIPSGLDATTGHVLGRCVRAARTFSFALPKIGLAVFPGLDYVGELHTVDIGIPPSLVEEEKPACFFVDAEEGRRLLPQRPLDAHKGTFGHLLVIGGSTGKSGAAAMTADSAVRAGAGLVTLACPAGVHTVLEGKLTEPMTLPLTEVDGEISMQAMDVLAAAWENKQGIAVGPGLGQGAEVQALIRRLVRACPLPMVIDADGLNALAGHLEILAERQTGTTVLTPHPGEMARLANRPVAEIQTDRVAIARNFASQHGVVLILKGARTVTAAPDGTVWINGSGNPGMASGGMGDVLTGLVAGLVVQKMDSACAAALGTYLHGLAADRLALRHGCAGLAAGDVLRELPAARHWLTTSVDDPFNVFPKDRK